MSKNALPYYKAYPRDFFEGTMGMDGELKAFYRLLLDIIYMKSGELPEDDRYIAGLLGISLRKWRSLKEKLVESGKIFIENGIISNKRACFELETTRKYQEKQAENGAKSNKNNKIEKPPLNQPEPEPEPYIYTTPTLEEERKAGAKGQDLFEAFFETYPRTEGQSRSRAKAEWDRLTPDEQSAAVAAIPKLKPELDKMRGGGWMPFVYLRDRIFETVSSEPGKPVAECVPPPQGTSAYALFERIVSAEGVSVWASWFAGCVFEDTHIYPPKRFVEETIRKRWARHLERAGVELMPHTETEKKRKAA